MGLVSAARSVAHTYDSPGSYTITATATDNGNTFSTSTVITVAPRLAFGVNVSASSSTPKVNTPVVFTATVTGDTTAPVASYEWTFTDSGSSQTVTTSGNQITRAFGSTGTKTIDVIARAADGRSASSQTQIVVVP